MEPRHTRFYWFQNYAPFGSERWTSRVAGRPFPCKSHVGIGEFAHCSVKLLGSASASIWHAVASSCSPVSSITRCYRSSASKARLEVGSIGSSSFCTGPLVKRALRGGRRVSHNQARQSAADRRKTTKNAISRLNVRYSFQSRHRYSDSCPWHAHTAARNCSYLLSTRRLDAGLLAHPHMCHSHAAAQVAQYSPFTMCRVIPPDTKFGTDRGSAEIA